MQNQKSTEIPWILYLRNSANLENWVSMENSCSQLKIGMNQIHCHRGLTTTTEIFIWNNNTFHTGIIIVINSFSSFLCQRAVISTLTTLKYNRYSYYKVQATKKNTKIMCVIFAKTTQHCAPNVIFNASSVHTFSFLIYLYFGWMSAPQQHYRCAVATSISRSGRIDLLY